MHPLCVAVDAAVEAGLDFMIVVGGDAEKRLKMGLPPSVKDRDPLILAFPAQYHQYASAEGDDVGLRCVLSFDTLYPCRIPWNAIRQFVIDYRGDEKWPIEWDGDAADGQSDSDDGSNHANVLQLKPRSKDK